MKWLRGRAGESESDTQGFYEVAGLPAISTLHQALAQARSQSSVITLFKDWTRLTTGNHDD